MRTVPSPRQWWRPSRRSDMRTKKKKSFRRGSRNQDQPAAGADLAEHAHPPPRGAAGGAGGAGRGTPAPVPLAVGLGGLRLLGRRLLLGQDLPTGRRPKAGPDRACRGRNAPRLPARYAGHVTRGGPVSGPGAEVRLRRRVRQLLPGVAGARARPVRAPPACSPCCCEAPALLAPSAAPVAQPRRCSSRADAPCALRRVRVRVRDAACPISTG